MKIKTLPARRPLSRFASSLCCVSLASLAASACSSLDSSVEDLGDTEAIVQDLDTPVDEPFHTSASEFAGRWIGVAEDVLALGLAPGEPAPVYRFPSGATSIELELEFLDDSNGLFPNLSGTIRFGAGEPPPPPTDPNVGYPVGLSYIEQYAYDVDGPNNPQDPTLQVIGDPEPLPPLEGYVYPIAQMAFRSAGDGQGVPDGVALLTYSTGDYLLPWCELQTPVPDGAGGYGCLPPHDLLTYEDGVCYAGAHDDSACPPGVYDLPYEEQASVLEQCVVSTNDPVDCDKLFLCSGLQAEAPDNGRCFCDASGCTINYVSALYDSSAYMMLRRNGDELVGVVSEGWFLNERGLRVPLGTIRFQRAE